MITARPLLSAKSKPSLTCPGQTSKSHRQRRSRDTVPTREKDIKNPCRLHLAAAHGQERCPRQLGVADLLIELVHGCHKLVLLTRLHNHRLSDTKQSPAHPRRSRQSMHAPPPQYSGTYLALAQAIPDRGSSPSRRLLPKLGARKQATITSPSSSPPPNRTNNPRDTTAPEVTAPTSTQEAMTP